MSSSRKRVADHTGAAVNQRIQDRTVQHVRYFEGRGDQIPARLAQLSQEWDIERAIEAQASFLAFSGIAAATLTGDRRWLALSALVTAFLFQHAVQGWCPPIPVLRRLGFRTAYEIEQERTALKALRGDFGQVGRSRDRTMAALQAARA